MNGDVFPALDLQHGLLLSFPAGLVLDLSRFLSTCHLGVSTKEHGRLSQAGSQQLLKHNVHESSHWTLQKDEHGILFASKARGKVGH